MWVYISKEYIFYGQRVLYDHPASRGGLCAAWGYTHFRIKNFIVRWYCSKTLFTNTLKKVFRFCNGVRTCVIIYVLLYRLIFIIYTRGCKWWCVICALRLCFYSVRFITTCRRLVLVVVDQNRWRARSLSVQRYYHNERCQKNTYT